VITWESLKKVLHAVGIALTEQKCREIVQKWSDTDAMAFEV